MTSTAPMRGCSPVWVSMSISWTATSTSRSRAAVDRLVLAGHREHRPVVARVARPIEQEDAVARLDLDGLRHPVDDVEPAALRDVRDGFDQHPTMLVRRRTVVGPVRARPPRAALLRLPRRAPRWIPERNATLCVVPSARPRTNTRQVFFHDLSTFHSNTYSSRPASYLKPLRTLDAGGLARVRRRRVPHAIRRGRRVAVLEDVEALVAAEAELAGTASRDRPR